MNRYGTNERNLHSSSIHGMRSRVLTKLHQIHRYYTRMRHHKSLSKYKQISVQIQDPT